MLTTELRPHPLVLHLYLKIGQDLLGGHSMMEVARGQPCLSLGKEHKCMRGGSQKMPKIGVHDNE